MTAMALVTGTLFRPPEQRTSKAGKPFVTATIRVKDGDDTRWWKVLAFSESIKAELMRMADGDAIILQDTLKEAPSDTLASRSMRPCHSGTS